MRVALDHVIADAVTPAFGRLLLGSLRTISLKVDMCTTSTLPPNGDGTINIPELDDTQIVTVIVMGLADDVVGWYDQYMTDDQNYEDSVTLLTGLGVSDPPAVISDAAKAFADVNPKRRSREPRRLPRRARSEE